MKYAPRKVYIRESGGYVELSYTEFCRCRESDQTYMDKLFIPIQKETAALIFQSCCGNQRTTSNSSDFAPIWLLGAQIKIKKEPITAVFQTAYYRLCVCASGSFN